MFFFWCRDLVLVSLELDLELYKYIAEMETDLQPPHLAWRAVSLSFDRRMQDDGEGLEAAGRGMGSIQGEDFFRSRGGGMLHDNVSIM